MEKVFEIATRISTPLVLAGVVIIVLFFVYLAVIKRLKTPTANHSFAIFRQIVWVIFVLGLVSLLLGFLGYMAPVVESYMTKNPLYRVRVTVVDSNNRPVKGAEITSNPAGEQKDTESGSEIVIPDSVISKDRTFRVWGTKDDGIFKGYAELLLGGDYNPTLTLVLQRDTSARIKGQIKDEDGDPIPGIIVYVQDYPQEKTTTDIRGRFDLPAHVAPNEYVHLFIEGDGYQPWNDVIPAGGESLATISITKKK